MQLVYRAQLTMHTAFSRADNTEPAAVTSLAVSRDHRTLFVGDERGRVYSWGVGTRPGKGMVDHWVRDDTQQGCQDCGVRLHPTQNIPYGQSSAKLPVTWSLGHSVTQSLNHLLT